jgi:hypothetical protein
MRSSRAGTRGFNLSIDSVLILFYRAESPCFAAHILARALRRAGTLFGFVNLDRPARRAALRAPPGEKAKESQGTGWLFLASGSAHLGFPWLSRRGKAKESQQKPSKAKDSEFRAGRGSWPAARAIRAARCLPLSTNVYVCLRG